MNPTPRVMDMDELVSEISAADRGQLSPEVVRRCLNLLSELVGDETQKGRRVEIECFGNFSLSPVGQLAFSPEPIGG